MRNPFKRKALTGSSEVVAAINSGQWAPFRRLGADAQERVARAYQTAQSANYGWLYRRSPSVRTVIDCIARNVGQLDLRLYEEVSEQERKPRPDHPAAMSLRYPNRRTTRDSWVRSIVKDFLIYDNAYSLVSPAPDNQLTLNRLPVPNIQLVSDQLFDADIFRYWRLEGTGFVDFTPDQIFHWRGESPDDPRMGTSKLETLRDVIAEDVALQQAIIELAQAGLQAPVWAYRPLNAPEISDRALTGLEEDITGRLRRKNKVVALAEGMELRTFGVSPRDAQMLEVRRWAIERVSAEYGLPSGMVLAGSDLAAAQKSFYADTLPPLCQEFSGILNLRILVEAYDWTDGTFEFNLDEKLMGDERLSALVSATGRPVMLTNEARAMINRPPVKDGDKLVTPMNVLVGDNPKPSPGTMGPQNAIGPAQDGSARPGRQPIPAGQPTKTPPAPPGAGSRQGKALPEGFRMVDEVAMALQEAYSRQEEFRGRRQRKSGTLRSSDNRAARSRFVRDLTKSLGRISPTVDPEGAKAVADGVFGALDEALSDAPARAVFRQARESADGLAKSMVVALGMDVEMLRELGVPREALWERAGFLPEQVDQMKAMEYAEVLADGGEEE